MLAFSHSRPAFLPSSSILVPCFQSTSTMLLHLKSIRLWMSRDNSKTRRSRTFPRRNVGTSTGQRPLYFRINRRVDSRIRSVDQHSARGDGLVDGAKSPPRAELRITILIAFIKRDDTRAPERSVTALRPCLETVGPLYSSFRSTSVRIQDPWLTHKT